MRVCDGVFTLRQSRTTTTRVFSFRDNRVMQITTAEQAAARDADAIASGTDSWQLMHQAGSAAARVIAGIASSVEAPFIWVAAGTGNNGGDAYVVATELLANEFNVVLAQTGDPRTQDAKRARELYREARELAGPAPDMQSYRGDGRIVVVDGILGTGQRGPLREVEQQYAAHINRFGGENAVVIALDVPTGVNATTGEIVEDAVQADYTIAFGTMKRAHVLQRAQCGEVVVLDIGLGVHAEKDDGAWELADAPNLRLDVPAIAWNAHKGQRGRLAIVGGTSGMAGAVTLSTNAALRSGAGLVHAFVHESSVLALQISIPQAMAHAWPANDSQHDARTTPIERLRDSLREMHAVAIGPGFGRTSESREFFGVLLGALPDVPIVLDADAITLLGSDRERLRALTTTREVVCTPHVREFAKLIGEAAADSLDERISQARTFANDTGATILLKGTPSVVISPSDTTVTVIARGTSALATGGSGDMLTGIVGTLLAQGASGADAAAIAAYVHGRAAELATDEAGSVRGITLTEVLNAFGAVWKELADVEVASDEFPVVLAQLPSLT